MWVRWLEKVLDVLHSSALCTAGSCVVQINDLKTYLNSTYLTSKEKNIPMHYTNWMKLKDAVSK